MTNFMVACYVVMVLGSLAIGAYLVSNGHPYFAIFVIIMAGCVKFKYTNDEGKKDK